MGISDNSSSIGNLLGQKNANRAGAAANASMLICVLLALFLWLMDSFVVFLYLMVGFSKWYPSDFPSDVGIYVQQ